MQKKLTVVLPAYNEADHILPTLRALLFQLSTNFDVVFVDNGSTDNTREIITSYIENLGLKHWHVIDEPEKGTGAAADTGMRWAAAHGADYIARTDTDCLPREDWTREIIKEMDSGTQFIA